MLVKCELGVVSKEKQIANFVWYERLKKAVEEKFTSVVVLLIFILFFWGDVEITFFYRKNELFTHPLTLLDEWMKKEKFNAVENNIKKF